MSPPKKSADLSPIYNGIIEELARQGLLYATTIRGPDDTLKAALEAKVAADEVVTCLLGWTFAGQRTGHEWFACSACPELRLMKVKARRRCTTNTPLMPPRCPGHMTRIATRPILRDDLREVLGP
jgi:hypothetical protein